ncbi:MSMEG_0570 family nitrogen starvation response protein [Williamsia sp. CHRR-6]|uniref:MSMEG_0570 family nitrogen starvation response protein n=1 Tax=Williamsia sp. CHRR-6 TaxID=2835871 RepID=UPI001BDAE54E|nr:MSMEG_0570 family nitrogen starvation response protein [Williamsia sp. CHRR-6]MBT0568080.1 MSMEG_0570 family nitrogen starvation response protein [Williamsia sp. CHRR-6]
MPEMTFEVRWPDGRVDRCYSPSLVMHDHLAAHTVYSISDFVSRAATALDIASERVRAKYGFGCTSAMATLELIRSRAARFGSDEVVVVGVLDPTVDAPAHIVPATPPAATTGGRAAATEVDDKAGF